MFAEGAKVGVKGEDRLTGEWPELDPLALGFHQHWLVFALAWGCSPANR